MSSPPRKRARDETIAGGTESMIMAPSQVVYVKDLKPNVCEADFHDALSEFGPISYVLCMREFGKALIEFEDLRSACECVAKAKTMSIKVAGQTATFQFSKSSFIRRSGLESQYASNVLVLTIHNVLYPITVDVIYQISTLHGGVLRIALLNGKENGELQALVEFDTVATARRAKHAMNGADIYAGCCTLKVEFAKVESSLEQIANRPLRDLNFNTVVPPTFDKNQNALKHNGGLSKSPVIMIYGLDVERFNCDRVFNLLCSYGDCLKVKFLRSMTGTCMAEMKNADDAQNTIQFLRGCKIFENDLEFTFSRNETLRDPVTEVYKLPDNTSSFKDFTKSRNLRFINPDVASKNKLVFPTSQLHFFNAPASMTEERIRKIFENHGIVPQEIIMSKKKTERSSSGFVSFNCTSEALEALVICNHTPVKEPEIKNPYIFKLAFALEREEQV